MCKLLILAVFSFLVVSCGQNPPAKPIDNDLSQLENEWMHAMMNRDRLKLEELMGPEFSMSGMKYIDSPAVSRNMWMNNTMQDLKVDSIHFITTKVTTINDVGIVRASMFWSGSYDEDHFADTSLFVDTWIRRTNGWVVVSRIAIN